MTEIAIVKSRIKIGGENASYGSSTGTSIRTYAYVQPGHPCGRRVSDELLG